MTMPAVQAERRLIVSGRVQGVGFRMATCRRARELGVSGWVRNRRDGTVEIHVQGSAEAVQSLVEWAHHGPRAAKVTSVREAQAEVQASEADAHACAAGDPAVPDDGAFVELPTV